MTQPRRILGFVVFAVGAPLLTPRHLWAQQQPPATCADWTSIQSWNGTITVSGSGQSTDQIGSTVTVSENTTITFTLPANTGNNCSFPLATWVAPSSQVIYSVNMQDQLMTPSVDPATGTPCSITQTWNVANGNPGGLGSGGAVSLGLDFSNQANPAYVMSYSSVVSGVAHSISGCGNSGTNTVSTVWGPTTTFACGLLGQCVPNSFPLPATISPLTGSFTFQSDAGNVPNGMQQITWTVSWNIAPAPPDVDVLVTIQPDYPTWRPTAGKSETNTGAPGDIGNSLVIQAQLIQKSTGQLAVGVIPDKWSFNLVGVSHEPGLTMNWPSVNDRANPSPPDMTFDALINHAVNPGLTISNNDTLAEVLNPSQTAAPPEAAAVLVSFDWGGWATLNVTATVFGTPIKGHLQLPNGQNVTDIPLPLRQPGSNIANVWKTQNNVPLSTPDSDDSETDPDGLPGCVGDGLTLYEEYRGFMENGKHIEGDPNKKDFFIQNLIGADAEPGIWLFTELSGLNVHKDIQKDEMDGFHTSSGPGTGFGTRLINFNHAQGAHEVDQHGVFILTCNLLGGKTFLSVPGVHGRPGITNSICMQNRDAVGFFSLNPSETHGGAITPQNALVQYDVGIAHELFHSAGVDHHGDGDLQQQVFTLLPPNDPRNTTGQAVFQLSGQNVRMLREKDNTDMAADMWQNMLNKYAYWQNVVANPSQFDPVLVELGKEYVQEFPFSDFLRALISYVGRPHAEHSGDDRCLMRYFFANAYPSIYPQVGLPVFYNVTPGTEPVGAALCNGPAGNPGGVNDPNRPIPPGFPQPRYFDAARGDCQHQVCVNDKNSPGSNN